MKEILDKMEDSNIIYSKIKIEQIIKKFKIIFENSMPQFVESINKDYEKYLYRTKIEDLSNIINEKIEEEIEIKEKIEGKIWKDGYGTIVAIYNGKPIITLTLLLLAIKTHNKILLCAENHFEVNNLIINLLKKVIKEEAQNENVINISNEYYDICDCQELIDKIIFIGNKYDYVQIKKRIGIDIEYNGYGYISLFFDNDNEKEEIEKMKLYAVNNLIDLEIYTGDIEKTIKDINYLRKNQTVVIFSQDKNNILKLALKIKANEVYINKNPFKDYKIKINSESFLTKKEII